MASDMNFAACEEGLPNNDVDSEEMLIKMRTLHKKFRNACNQVILLNNQIEELQSRYNHAVHSNKRSYRYFLRLRLAKLEGIRNMFYEFACRCADRLDEMQDTLVQEGVIDSDYDMEAVDSDNEQETEIHLHQTVGSVNSMEDEDPGTQIVEDREESQLEIDGTFSVEDTFINQQSIASGLDHNILHEHESGLSQADDTRTTPSVLSYSAFQADSLDTEQTAGLESMDSALTVEHSSLGACVTIAHDEQTSKEQGFSSGCTV